MRFEISDDALLKVSGVALGAFGVNSGLAPRQFHDQFFEKAWQRGQGVRGQGVRGGGGGAGERQGAGRGCTR